MVLSSILHVIRLVTGNCTSRPEAALPPCIPVNRLSPFCHVRDARLSAFPVTW